MTPRYKSVDQFVVKAAAISFFYFVSWMAAVGESPVDAAKAPAHETIVAGSVTNQEGGAIAGATIEWGRDDERFRSRQRVTTDANGAYTVTLRSVDDRHRLAASAVGFSPVVIDSRFKPGRNERDITLTKSPADSHLVTGTVVDERGHPIEGAIVEALTPVVGFHSSFSMPTGRDYFPGPDRIATTDKEGRFRIEDLTGEEVLLNVTAKHRHANDDNFPIRENLRITMSGSGQAGVIQGRIVEAETGEPPSDLSGIRIVPRYSTKVYECSGEGGRFQLPMEVTEGQEYILYVYAKRYAAIEVRVRAFPIGSDSFPRIALTDGPLLRGKVIDAETGKPVSDVHVLYGIADEARYFEWSSFDRYADGHHSLEFVQHDKTNERGGFWFAEPADSKSRGAILIWADGYTRMLLRPEAREIDKGTGELIIRMERESAIVGVVTKDGKPLPNESVSVNSPAVEKFDHMYEHVRTDEQGRYKYGRLAAGKYHIFGGPYGRVANVGKGETLTVNLGEDLGPIRIHGKAAPSITITLSPEFTWDYVQFTTEATSDGAYEFRGLKPGKYRVSQHFAYPTGFIDHTSFEIEVTNDAQQIDLMATPDFDAGPAAPAGIRYER